MKKLISTILAILLLSSLMVGCGDKTTPTSNDEKDKATEIENFNASGYPIVTEKITLKMMGQKSPAQSEWADMEFFKKMESMTNVSLEFNTPLPTAIKEKVGLAFASQELPDVFMGVMFSKEDEIKYGGQGALIPLEKLIDNYAPNIKKIIDGNAEIRKSITAADGHIYTLPFITQSPYKSTSGYWINKKWLDQVGMEMPKTVDELHDVMVAFRDKDPNGNGKNDEIPMSPRNVPVSGITLQSLRNGIMPAFGLIHNNNKEMIQEKDGKVIFVPTENNYKEYLKYLNKLYTEKLIDNECFVQNRQQQVAKWNNSTVGIIDGAPPVKIFNDYVPMPPITSSISSEKIFSMGVTTRTGQFAITKENKYPEATIRWVDYLYSDEGSQTVYAGVEGTNWKWSDGEKSKWEFVDPKLNRAKFTPGSGTYMPYIYNDSFTKKNSKPYDVRYDKLRDETYSQYLKAAIPDISLTEDEFKRVSESMGDIRTYISQRDAKYINGEKSFDEWDKDVQQIKKMGIDDAVKIYQQAYDRYMKAE